MPSTAELNKQKTILVVDDDQSIMKFVAGLLAKSGYNVLTASSGAAALTKSHAHEGDIDLL
ncbi:MAG: response regulator, partial [Bryobacteraceae bacterium]